MVSYFDFLSRFTAVRACVCICRSKAGPLDWEFQKDRLCMTGTPVFYYHEER